MAQSAYTGLPGSGKSYGVVEHVILPALQKGRRIYTNIPLNMELIEATYPGQARLFQTSDILENNKFFKDDFIPGSTFILDEAWRIWPAGVKAADIPEAHKEFLAMHRHMVGVDGFSTEIVLVTQDLSQIASYPRGLTETTYRAVKLVAVGRTQNYRIDVYMGVCSGPNPPAKNRVRQLFGSYKPEIYQYYKSQTMSEADGHGSETGTDDRINILSSKLFKFGMPAAIVALIVFGGLGLSQFSNMYHPKPKAVIAQPPPPDPVQVVPVAPSPPPAPVEQPPSESALLLKDSTASIVFNNGRAGYYDYRIQFAQDDAAFTLSVYDLDLMGFRIVGHGPCLVEIIGHGITKTALCEHSDYTGREVAVSDTGNSAPAMP